MKNMRSSSKNSSKKVQSKFVITSNQQKQLISEMKKKFKDSSRFKIGIKQLLALWDKQDGDFNTLKEFCLTYFLDDKKDLLVLQNKLEEVFEKLAGHFIEVHSSFSKWKDLEIGPFTPFDQLLSNYNPFKHSSDDFYEIKLPFVILLNFKQYSFKYITENYKNFDREKWLEIKLTEGYQGRIPAEISHKQFLAYNEADTYINQLNIYMNKLIDNEGTHLYTEEKRLISHWGLRDEIKSLYADYADTNLAAGIGPDPTKRETSIKKQELIFKVMENIIKGTTPIQVINSQDHTWNPYETPSKKSSKYKLEGERRYQYWLNIFKTTAEVDKYYLNEKTHIDRRFNLNRKIPEKKIEKIFLSLLSSPALAKTAELMKKKLARPLRPYDVWYTGFKRSIKQEDLNKLVQEQFADLNIFNEKIPLILQKIGFTEEKAKYLASFIRAEPSRSAGHARGAGMRGEKALLRVRSDAGKLNYESFNTSMHELGHTVEQTISMNLIDNTLLEGVPNTAFTEAIAFLFQGMDQFVLGAKNSNDNNNDNDHNYHEREAYLIIDSYFNTCEIASMALVDMYSWRYLYKTKNVTAKNLKDFVIKTANELWKKYWAPYFGESDSAILAIYSHMIDAGLYLPDYPIGHIINYQIKKYFKHNDLATNLERICKLGSIYPDPWMEAAIGQTISADELIADTLSAFNNLL
ncbi:MAG: hypothetical protein HQK51_05470 [Oligoflexia bacterium]|nr:hypothetical protein [Oligoflexia bacterium]